jgi:1,4-dihydroxy-2-naphthoate polyprenyltransferase
VLGVLIALTATPWALIAFASLPLALAPVAAVRSGARGRDLVPVLAGTGKLQLAYGALLAIGLALT